jgi:hypothetical protein
VSGYVLDDLALIAGLTGEGAEPHRRELSRLLLAAIGGGQPLPCPRCAWWPPRLAVRPWPTTEPGRYVGTLIEAIRL